MYLTNYPFLLNFNISLLKWNVIKRDKYQINLSTAALLIIKLTLAFILNLNMDRATFREPVLRQSYVFNTGKPQLIQVQVTLIALSYQRQL